VSKEEFSSIYFRLGGGPRSGWTADYWKRNLADLDPAAWRFLVEDPASAAHDQMWMVADHGAGEVRLFFTDESGDDILRSQHCEEAEDVRPTEDVRGPRDAEG